MAHGPSYVPAKQRAATSREAGCSWRVRAMGARHNRQPALNFVGENSSVSPDELFPRLDIASDDA